MLVEIACRMCKTVHTVEVDTAAYRRWQGGMMIQDAFPDMDAGIREMFISQTCPSCWDKIFAKVDEDDNSYVKEEDDPAQQKHLPSDD